MPSATKVHHRLLPLLPLVGIALLVLLAWDSPILLKKVLGLLVMPVGILWILLAIVACAPRWTSMERLGWILLWGMYTLMGNPMVGSWMSNQLEKPYLTYAEPTEAFDAICVLGGGTYRTPTGAPALGSAGDRVYTAAKWFHKGLTSTLVTTGRSITEMSQDRLLSEETSIIWQTLGIPKSAIIEIPDARNTKEEIAALAELIRESDWKRVGLCTSASHMPRSQQLCQKHQLDLIPVPCNFLSGPRVWHPMHIIPQGGGLNDVQRVLWECLGMLVNRVTK